MGLLKCLIATKEGALITIPIVIGVIKKIANKRDTMMEVYNLVVRYLISVA